MRIRSNSLLAVTSTLAVLLGCPFETLAPEPDESSAEASSDTGLRNTAAHDDPIDALDDVSWVNHGQLGAGSAALRVLMTDAPIEADNVFVTFCGIYVEPIRAEESGADGAFDAARREQEGERSGAGAPPPPPPPEGSPRLPEEDSDQDWRADEDRDASQAASEDPERYSQPSDDTDYEEAEREEAERERIERELEERERAERERVEADPGADPDEPMSEDGEHASDGRGGWIAVSDECQTLDLLTLRDGVTEAVGVAALPPGEYGPMRLMLTRASIVVDGVEHELVVPSGAESGLKVGSGFSLRDGSATTVTVDFDAARSIHYAPGNGFMMTPVIQVIDVQAHGTEPGQAKPEPRDERPRQPEPPPREGREGEPPPPDGRRPEPPPDGMRPEAPPPNDDPSRTELGDDGGDSGQGGAGGGGGDDGR